MDIQDLTASLDLKQNLNIYVQCKQNDSLNLILSIFDNSVAVNVSSYRIRLRAMKADKVPLIQEHIGISASGNIVNIEAHEQLTTVAGKTPIELQFIDKITGRKKATFNLVLIIIESTISIDASISTATYTLLEELENKLDQASDFFENIETAMAANNNLKTTITNSETAKNNLENTIAIADDSREELKNEIDLAEDTIIDLIQTNKKYTDHINNTDIHVTKVDKNNWDRINDVINLLDAISNDIPITDEKLESIIDENGKVWTM
ncbi:MAG: hypothetical protein E7206_09020 [Clostridium beijerinckii]|nr:hypothetical protein [Clostridium beijerinckii]